MGSFVSRSLDERELMDASQIHTLAPHAAAAPGVEA